jgi:hypothetical protein
MGMLFGKKGKTEVTVVPIVETKGTKYPKPKILLADLNPKVETLLTKEGYNVSSGTFGKPYNVPRGDGFRRVGFNSQLPSITEQEIVIANLHEDDISTKDMTPGDVPKTHSGYWAEAGDGIVDPRPIDLAQYRSGFDRILSHGGVFVLFVGRRFIHNFHYGRIEYGELVGQTRTHDSWSIHSGLTPSEMKVQEDEGEEIQVIKANTPFNKFFAKHLEGCRFDCIMAPNFHTSDRWQAAAINKYEYAVAGVLRAATGKGFTILLPAIVPKTEDFLLQLLTNVLPEMAPHLFPYLEGSNWLARPEYELSAVTDLHARIDEVSETANKQMSALATEAEAYSKKYEFLYELLTATDDKLVSTVKKTLEFLGLTNVIDADEEGKKAGKVNRDEDLHIRDKKPALVIEVKGVTGKPADDGPMQAIKYKALRMQEWGRTDVQGLSIINHERGMPPLNRADPAFRGEMVQTALTYKIGLMTTWTLFRIAVNLLHHKWNPEYVTPLFDKIGPIEHVPAHYQLIGKIEKLLDKKSVIGVRMTEGTLSVGDRIAYESTLYFFEEQVTSMHLDDKQVQAVKAGDGVGVLTTTKLAELREGARVFRVNR